MTWRGCTRPEGGVSLVEVLVALAILGIAVTSIVAGLSTASIASNDHRSQVNADSVVRSYAEAIKEQVRGGTTLSCRTSYKVPATTWQPPAGYTVSLGTVRYWHAAAGSFTLKCRPEEGARLLSLSGKSPDGRDTESLQVIVRTP